MAADLSESQQLSIDLAFLAGDVGCWPEEADDQTLHLLGAMATLEGELRAEEFAALEALLGGFFFDSLALGDPVAFAVWRRALVRLDWHRPAPKVPNHP